LRVRRGSFEKLTLLAARSIGYLERGVLRRLEQGHKGGSLDAVHPPQRPTPPNARPGVTMTRGKSLYAVRHTSHMSCGQIGDPQQDASCRLLSLTACISSRSQSRPLTALARPDCTSAVVGLPPAIHRRVLFTRRDGECVQGSASHWCHLEPRLSLVRPSRIKAACAWYRVPCHPIPSHPIPWPRPPSPTSSSTAKLARRAFTLLGWRCLRRVAELVEDCRKS